jgi:hypothetical protein
MSLMATMREMSDELLAARARGECRTAAETRAWFADRLTGPEDMRDAVRCTVCNDTGLVQCLLKVKQNKDGSWAKWYGVASCPCPKGDVPRNYPQEISRVPTYDECEHIRVISGATDEDLRAEIQRVRDRRDRAKRTTQFDAYNERASNAF